MFVLTWVSPGTRSRSSANAKQLLRSVLQCSSPEVCYGLVVLVVVSPLHCWSLPSYLVVRMNLSSHAYDLPDGQSSHEPPTARSLREYEEFAGISFEKRKLSVARPSVGHEQFLSIDTSEAAISTG